MSPSVLHAYYVWAKMMHLSFRSKGGAGARHTSSLAVPVQAVSHAVRWRGKQGRVSLFG